MSAQKDFWISRQKRLLMPALRVCVPGVQYSFWTSKEFPFLVVWSRGSHFWREPKINSRCYWTCVLSRWIFSQQWEMRISWWFRNNSNIHLWLWKMWSLVVCSQSSFYVITTREDDKNRQNTFFLLKIWICTRQKIVRWDPFSEQFPTNHNHPHQKRLKWVQIWIKRIHFLLADDLSNIFLFQIN